MTGHRAHPIPALPELCDAAARPTVAPGPGRADKDHELGQ